MEFEKGAVVKGRVTGIAKFGAFVELCPGKSGLVYISEISNTFVKDVADFLQVGQEVMVKVLNIDDAGRINLSIKQALPPSRPPEPMRRQPRQFDQQPPRQIQPRPQQPYSPQPRPQQPPVFAGPQFGGDEPPMDAEFEDKLKRFMKDSDSKMSDIRRQSERRGSKRRRN
jgi:S1 RNA binding domain protein